MPRGNDAQEALSELESRQGINANAEALIEANKERYPSELRAANNKAVDEEATADLDRDAVESAVADVAGKDATLVDGDDAFAVRGDSVVALANVDDHGRVEKFAIDLDDVGGSKKSSKRSTKKESKPATKSSDDGEG